MSVRSVKKRDGTLEESFTLAQFEQDWMRGEYSFVQPFPSQTGGTRLAVRTRRGKQKTILLSDLTAPIRMQLIAHTETVFTDTVSNNPAESLSIPANAYSLIMLEAELEMDPNLNELDRITMFFTPNGNASQATRLKLLGAASSANSGILSTRGSTMYKNQAAHNATVSVTVNAGTASYFIENFRAWGIP
jgi:hypothetical protein